MVAQSLLNTQKKNRLTKKDLMTEPEERVLEPQK